MFAENLPSKLSISRDLNSEGFIIQEGETPFGQKSFTAPIFKLTETITDSESQERTAIISDDDFQTGVTGFVTTVLKEMFGSYGFTVSKGTTEWSV